MSTAGGTTPVYRVNYTEAARTTLHDLGDRARQAGAADEFVSTLQAIDKRLRSAPMVAGEPLHFLPHLGLHVRHVGTPFFYLRFGVDQVRFLVFVIRCVGSARLP